MDTAETEFVEMVEAEGLPVFETSESAIKVMAALYKFRLQNLDNPEE